MYEERQTLEDLTAMFYEALNDRKGEIFRRLWLDDSSVAFYAGDGNMTCG
jgi:hypothetical protein